MIETSQMGDTLRQSGKAKKQILVRKKLDESIAQARQYEKHPYLPNTVVQVSQKSQQNTTKHNFKQAANMVRRVSKVMAQKDLTQSGLQTQHSQRSYDSSQVKSKYLYHQKSQFPEDNYISEIDGPQVKMNKNFISFMTYTGKVAFESVIVTNNGNASIYYDWESIDNERQNQQALKEIDPKFFCHHEQNVIKPGEEKKFVFSFLSNVTGIFNQEWVLNCSPPTTKPLARIKLSGHSIIEDRNIEWRHQYNRSLYESYIFKGMQEIVNDVIEQVKTPTPPLPDLTNPEVCREEFEQKNKQLNLYYNPLVIKWWRDLELSLYEELKLDPQQQYWDMDVQYLKDLIEKVYDEEQKLYYEKRFKSYEELSQIKPIERREIYNSIRQKVVEIAENIPVISDGVRKENELWEYQFLPPSDDEIDSDQEFLDQQLEKEKIQSQEKLDPKAKKQQQQHNQSQQSLEEENYDGLTEEEIEQKKQLHQKRQSKLQKIRQKIQEKQAQQEELNKLKGEWAKKRKKKLTEEDEKNLLLQCTQTISQKTNSYLLEQFESFENNDQYYRLDDQLQEIEHDKDYFENVLRKMSVQDIDIDGKRILLKVHLKIKSDPESQQKQEIFKQQIVKKKEEELKKIEEERLLQEKLAKEKKKGRRPAPKKKKKDEEPVQQEIKLDLSFLDQDNLQQIIEQVKFFLDKSCKMIILMVSFDQKLGKYALTSSTKFFYEHLKTQVENQVFFSEDVIIDNYEEKIESEQFGDNSVLVLENCYFQPQEINFKFEKQVKQSVLDQQQQELEKQLQSQDNIDNQSKTAKSQQQLSQQQISDQHNKSQQQQIQKSQDQETDLEKLYDAEDLEDVLVKYYHEDKQEYINYVNEYASYLVIEDKFNFFSKQTSMVDLTLDNNVLGNNLGQEIQNSAYMMYLDRNPQVIFMAGEITPQKLLLLNILLKQSFRVLLLGEFGLAAYLIRRNLEQIEGLQVPEIKKQGLQKVLNQNEESDIQIIVPTDFTISIKPKVLEKEIQENQQQEKEKEKDNKKNVKDTKKKGGKSKKEEEKQQQQGTQQEIESAQGLELNSDEYFKQIKENTKNWLPSSKYVEMGEDGETIHKELETPLEEGYMVIDFGQQSLNAIEDSINSAKKLIWIGDLSINQDHPQIQVITKETGKLLYKIQEQKQEKLLQERQDPLYNYEDTFVCFLLGKQLKDNLCSHQLKEIIQKKKKKPTNLEDGEELEDNNNNENNNSLSQAPSEQLQQEGEEEEEDENEDDEDKSISSQKQKNVYNPQDNINTLADFYIQDEHFSSTFITHPYIHTLSNISSHHINTEPDIDEGLSFLDDIKLE